MVGMSGQQVTACDEVNIMAQGNAVQTMSK